MILLWLVLSFKSVSLIADDSFEVRARTAGAEKALQKVLDRLTIRLISNRRV